MGSTSTVLFPTGPALQKPQQYWWDDPRCKPLIPCIVLQFLFPWEGRWMRETDRTTMSGHPQPLSSTLPLSLSPTLWRAASEKKREGLLADPGSQSRASNSLPPVQWMLFPEPHRPADPMVPTLSMPTGSASTSARIISSVPRDLTTAVMGPETDYLMATPYTWSIDEPNGMRGWRVTRCIIGLRRTSHNWTWLLAQGQEDLRVMETFW